MTIMLFAYASLAQGQDEPGVPSYNGYVNDFANVISSDDELAIIKLVRELDTKTTAQVAVLTVPTTRPLEIQQYSVAVFEKWGIGSKVEDNGALILMAVNDRKVWITTGYGLEGAIPDAVASQVVNQIMMPEFKKGQLSKGLLLGAAAVAQLAAKEYNVTLTGAGGYVGQNQLASVRKPRSLASVLFSLFFFILIFGMRSGLLFYFILGSSGRRRGGMWYGSGVGGTGGGFSGGFGGFGGGLTGGGGAGGGW